MYACGAFPVVLGGDHSIGYPTVRGVPGTLAGTLGIIHFDYAVCGYAGTPYPVARSPWQSG